MRPWRTSEKADAATIYGTCQTNVHPKRLLGVRRGTGMDLSPSTVGVRGVI